jgi:hypothetical protein
MRIEKDYKLLFILIFFSGILGLAKSSQATTINAASCSYADVSSAISSASAGDMVSVPTGSCTWASTLGITKGISIIGAGIGNTVITRSGANALFSIDPADYSDTTNPYRVSGFTLDLNTTVAASAGLYIGTYYKLWSSPAPALPKVRIDHVRFTNALHFSAQAIVNYSTMVGVVDNCTFDNVYYPIRNDSGDAGGEVRSQALLDYVLPYWDLGNSYKIYFEDNTFSDMWDGGSQSIVADCQWGGSYAMRYNTITLSYPGQPIFDAHGYGNSAYVACFGTELYGNKIIYSGAGGSNLSSLRGGKNIVLANDHGGTNQPSGTNYYQEACPGVDDHFTQLIHDSYTFLNRHNTTGTLLDAGSSLQTSCNGLTNIPTEGRDFFDDTTNSGVRCGTLGNIPTTCTTGQGYWATSQSCISLSGMVGVNPAIPISGILYKCTALNTWTAFYTPYTYPHPFRTDCVHYPTICDSNNDTTPPAAPTGFIVN